MSEADTMKGQLETLETVYAELTGGRALITHQDGMHFHFDDGAEARSLPSAVGTGKALVHFAVNQLKQSTV